MEARAFGIDISAAYAGKNGKRRLNFERLAARDDLTFVSAHVGSSYSQPDPLFEWHWVEMARLGTCRIASFTPFFGESALTQMDAFFEPLAATADWSQDRAALWLTEAGINPPELITSTAQKMIEIFERRTGILPILYGSAAWMDKHIRLEDLPECELWLAEYGVALPIPGLEHSGLPRLPKAADSWLIQRTNARGSGFGLGLAFGAVGYNRFNGDRQTVNTFFGRDTETVPLKSKVLYSVKCVVPALYKRGGPGNENPVVGSLRLGEVCQVYEEREGWLRVDPRAQVWCMDDAQYFERIGARKGPAKVLWHGLVISPALYKRSGPGKHFTTLGSMKRNTEISVYEERGVWLRINPEGEVWCSGEPQYIMRLPEEAVKGNPEEI
jgi:uncharacterized protein YgiM (DUF1202 family)